MTHGSAEAHGHHDFTLRFADLSLRDRGDHPDDAATRPCRARDGVKEVSTGRGKRPFDTALAGTGPGSHFLGPSDSDDNSSGPRPGSGAEGQEHPPNRPGSAAPEPTNSEWIAAFKVQLASSGYQLPSDSQSEAATGAAGPDSDIADDHHSEEADQVPDYNDDSEAAVEALAPPGPRTPQGTPPPDP